MANGTLFTQRTPYTRTRSSAVSLRRFKGRRRLLSVPARLHASELFSARNVSASSFRVTRGLTQKKTSEVSDVLEWIRSALTLSFPSQSEVVFEGHGSYYGNDVIWRLRCRPDGAFLEEIKGKSKTLTWGYDGGQCSKCWRVDDSGIPRQLDLDDHESLLLSVWVRSGFWLNPNTVEARAPPIIINLQESESVPADAVDNTTAPEGQCEPQLPVPPGAPSTSSPRLPTLSPSLAAETTLAVQLPHGQVVSMVTVSTQTWQPISMKLVNIVDEETWHFCNWQSWDANVHFPSETQSMVSGGHANRLCTVTVKPAHVAPMASYSMPPSPLRPADTEYNSKEGSHVPAWRTPKGGLVVRPLVNGQFAGYMLLDTGATKCFLEKGAADKLRLPASGEVTTRGLSGTWKSQFRRAASLSLGPLLLKDPVFTEISHSDLFEAGAPGPIVGVLGYDLFRRAVITIPPADKSFHEDPMLYQLCEITTEVTLLVEDPESFTEPEEVADNWQKTHMIRKLPHVEANFLSQGHQKARPAMFMVDSGWSGIDVVFHDRGVARHALTLDGEMTTESMKGAGGATKAASMATQHGFLRALELQSTRFENLSCALTGPGVLGFLSVYTSGLICAMLMARCTVIVDYARGRMAFLPADEERKSGWQDVGVKRWFVSDKSTKAVQEYAELVGNWLCEGRKTRLLLHFRAMAASDVRGASHVQNVGVPP